MNLQKYIELIREINQKKGIEWDQTSATLAIYKYLKSPALSDYYKNIEFRRDYDGSPIICGVAHNGYVLTTCNFFYDGKSYNISEIPNEITYRLEYNSLKTGPDNKFMSNEKKVHINNLRYHFMNANNFDSLTQGLTSADFKSFTNIADNFDFKISKMLKLATYWHNHKNTKDNEMKKKILDLTLSLVDDTYKLSNYKHQTLIDPIFNIMNKNKISDGHKFDDLYTIGAYDEIESNNHSFDVKSNKEKIEYYNQIAKMKQIKNSTVLGIVINNPDNIINKLVDTFIFDDLKDLVSIQTRLALKSSTLEDIFEQRPIVDEIYQEAVKRSPLLETSLDERFEHIKIIDKDYDLKGEESVQFKSIIDKVGLYSDYDAEHYLTLQTGLRSFPYDTDLITKKSRTERFIGHDGVGPYYMIFGKEDPFTMETNSLVLENFYISENLDVKHIKKMFENIFEDCMIRQLPLVIENSRMHGVLGSDKFQIFEEIKEKYKGIVPTIVHPTDLNKYRALLESELNYNQMIAIEPKLEELVKNNASLPVLMKSIEEYVAGNQDGVKLKNKL